MQVDVGLLERLIEPEEKNDETRGGGHIFQLFDTSERKGPSRGKQKALAEAPKRRGSNARKVAK